MPIIVAALVLTAGARTLLGPIRNIGFLFLYFLYHVLQTGQLIDYGFGVENSIYSQLNMDLNNNVYF